MNSSSQAPLNSYPNYFAGMFIPCIALAVLVLLALIIVLIEVCTAATNHSIARKHPELPHPKNGFLKRFFIYLAVAVVVLYVAQAIDCITNKTNKSGWINPFSRTARTEDVFVNQSYEFNLSDNYTVHPYYDIKNLKITVYFLDNNNQVVSTKSHHFKEVNADEKYNFSFSLSEFTASEIFSIRKWRSEVTGGTISYSATFAKLLSELN